MQYGFRRVAEILENNKAKPPKKCTLYMQCSSQGMMSGAYLDSFCSTLGCSQLELIWPTVEFVRTCIVGYAAGGSICFKENYYKNDKTKAFLQWKYE